MSRPQLLCEVSQKGSSVHGHKSQNWYIFIHFSEQHEREKMDIFSSVFVQKQNNMNIYKDR